MNYIALLIPVLMVLHPAHTLVKTVHLKFSWKPLDYAFNSTDTRQNALATSIYVPQFIAPLGMELWDNKLFLNTHRLTQLEGIPSSLNYVNLSSAEKSPPLIPYPNWDSNKLHSGYIDSALNMDIDTCDRLWVVDYSMLLNQSKLLIIDLKTNTIVKKLNLTKCTEKQLATGNVVLDLDESDCDKGYVYITINAFYLFYKDLDILVYDLHADTCWRVSRQLSTASEALWHAHYVQEIKHLPLLSDLSGIALSDKRANGYRTLYVQPANISYIFTISTESLQNPNTEASQNDMFDVLGHKGGVDMKSNYLYFDRKTGILFYDLRLVNAIGCWNSRKYPKFAENTTAVITCSEPLQYVFNLKADRSGNLWIATQDQRVYWPSNVTQIFSVNIQEFVKGTICE